MDKNSIIGIVILLAIIVIALTGGTKNASNTSNTSKGSFFAPKNQTEAQKQASIQKQINDVKKKTVVLQKQITAEETKKTASEYKGIVDLSSVRKSTDPNKEYLIIRVNNAKTPINVTGWTIKSNSSGASVKIPKGTYLFFADSINTEDEIYLNSGETLYITTGISPNGASFKTNKCSGYLTQFQTFTPSIKSSCPRPRDENLSPIPKTVNNDACLDYIESFPACKIQTKTLPANWSYECTNFIYSKINYPSCVNTHKNDVDFYQKEWRIYLKRSEKLWKDRREEIVLIDNAGKIVDALKY